jgi:hypothetical protein
MHASRAELPILLGSDTSGIRGIDWGNMRAAIVTVPGGTDLTPLFAGLLSDRCQCSHWGYVISGEMVASGTDGEEILVSGDLFYLPPGHSVRVVKDVEYVELSPPGTYEEFLSAAHRNLASRTTS